MQPQPEISLSTEALETGAPEERATYGLFCISAGAEKLTEGLDWYAKGHRVGPLVSGYHMAEWLAWHWWRHRWEPRRSGHEWLMAHRMSAIGAGYTWPNIIVHSDGLHTTLTSNPSSNASARPFRFTSSAAMSFAAASWESAVDDFFEQILCRLSERGIGDTNLHKLLDALREERADPELTRYRRLEALLGRDPDALDEAIVDGFLRDAAVLGQEAIAELAANLGALERSPDMNDTADGLKAIAEREGFSAHLADALKLARDAAPRPNPSHVPAWRWGVEVARQVRGQEGLDGQPIADAHLAAMAGCDGKAIEESEQTAGHIAYILKQANGNDRVVMRARRRTGRRFEMARLLGDRLYNASESLYPATRTYTYRQQAQRAFAAEFLSPVDNVIDLLNGQYDDEEERDRVAQHFDVSSMVIETQLMNKHLLPRYYYHDPDYVTAYAA